MTNLTLQDKYLLLKEAYKNHQDPIESLVQDYGINQNEANKLDTYLSTHPLIVPEKIEQDREAMRTLFSHQAFITYEINDKLYLKNEMIYELSSYPDGFSIADIISLEWIEPLLNKSKKGYLKITTISDSFSFLFLQDERDKYHAFYQHIYHYLSQIKDKNLFDMNIQPQYESASLNYIGTQMIKRQSCKLRPYLKYLQINSRNKIALYYDKIIGIHIDIKETLLKKGEHVHVDMDPKSVRGDDLLLTIDYQISPDQIWIFAFKNGSFTRFREMTTIYEILKKVLEHYRQTGLGTLTKEDLSPDLDKITQIYYRLAEEFMSISNHDHAMAERMFDSYKFPSAIPSSISRRFLKQYVLHPEIEIDHIATYRKKARSLFDTEEEEPLYFKQLTLENDIMKIKKEVFSIGDIINLYLKPISHGEDGVLKIANLQDDYQFHFSYQDEKAAIQFYQSLYQKLAQIKDPKTFDMNGFPDDPSSPFLYGGGNLEIEKYLLGNYLKVLFRPQHMILNFYYKYFPFHYDEISGLSIQKLKLKKKQPEKKCLVIEINTFQNKHYRVIFKDDKIGDLYRLIRSAIEAYQKPLQTKDAQTTASNQTVVCPHCHGINYHVEDITKTSCIYCDAPLFEPDKDIPVEQLTKLKHLLDNGIITQEEFEAKKKQLLGLS